MGATDVSELGNREFNIRHAQISLLCRPLRGLGVLMARGGLPGADAARL